MKITVPMIETGTNQLLHFALSISSRDIGELWRIQNAGPSKETDGNTKREHIDVIIR
jgi:hypothetical protein